MISFQSKNYWNCVLPHIHQTIWYCTVTVLKKHTTSIFREPPEDISSTFLWNTATQTRCNPNLRPHYVSSLPWKHEVNNLRSKNDKRSQWFKLGKLNYKYHIILFINTEVLCTTSVFSFFQFLKWDKKVKIYNIIIWSEPFWNAKFWGSTYVNRFAVNTTTQVTCNSQHTNQRNITTFTPKHDKF